MSCLCRGSVSWQIATLRAFIVHIGGSVTAGDVFVFLIVLGSLAWFAWLRHEKRRARSDRFGLLVQRRGGEFVSTGQRSGYGVAVRFTLASGESVEVASQLRPLGRSKQPVLVFTVPTTRPCELRILPRARIRSNQRIEALDDLSIRHAAYERVFSVQSDRPAWAIELLGSSPDLIQRHLGVPDVEVRHDPHTLRVICPDLGKKGVTLEELIAIGERFFEAIEATTPPDVAEERW